MIGEEYIYQAVSVHLREKEMLNKKDVERLAAAEDVIEVYLILSEKGWDTADLTAADADKLLIVEENMTWMFVESLLKDLTPFNVLRCGNDYHNLKAAIKLVYSEDEILSRSFFAQGSIDATVVYEAAKNHDFSGLPPDMAQAGKEAYETLSHTGNGQLCDIIIDSAALIAMENASKATRSLILKEYARFTIDSANIKTAIRCCGMGKNREFTERAIAPAGSLDTNSLIIAATENLEAIYEFLSRTEYSDAETELRRGIHAFERWCDDRIMETIRPQQNEFYTSDPMAAYIIARLTEIRILKLILSAKINALGMDVVSERLRETYV